MKSQKIYLDRRLYNDVLDKLSPDLTLHFRNTLNFHKTELTLLSHDDFACWDFDSSFEDFFLINIKKSKQPDWFRTGGLENAFFREQARTKIRNNPKIIAFKIALVERIEELNLVDREALDNPDFGEWLQAKIDNEFDGTTPSHFKKAQRTGNPKDLESSSNWTQWNEYCKTLKGEDCSGIGFEYGFVYFIRNQDIYKIGITQNLLQRLDQLKPDEVLNIVRCSNFEELEKILHKSFKENRIPQTEYFRLTQNQLNEVHQLMTTKAKF